MKPVAIAAIACITLTVAACSTPSSTSSSASPSASTSESKSPSPTQSRSTSPSAAADSAALVAASLGCDNITKQTPAGTTPKATTQAGCSLGGQGYVVLAFSSTASTTAAIASLKSQATGSGETMTIAAASQWIVKAAEGPTIGADMVTAAQKRGGKKVVLG